MCTQTFYLCRIEACWATRATLDMMERVDDNVQSQQTLNGANK